jgi:hypothetical protein
MPTISLSMIPVAALVLHGPQQAERHGVERAALMPQLDRADAETFDGALVVAALDVLADAERIVEQVEHAGDDVADKILRAKPDGDAEDAETRDQRADLDAHCRQHHQRGDCNNDDEQNIAENRQQRAQPGSPSRLVGVRRTEVGVLGELAIDRRLRCVPYQIGDEKDDDGTQRAVNKTGERRVLPGDASTTGFSRCCGGSAQRPHRLSGARHSGGSDHRCGGDDDRSYDPCICRYLRLRVDAQAACRCPRITSASGRRIRQAAEGGQHLWSAYRLASRSVHRSLYGKR